MQNKKPMPTSPYKAMMDRNKNAVPYRRMNQLEPNKAYKIFDIVHTEHAEFGAGERAHIKMSCGKKYMVQLPSKYLKSLTLPSDMAVIKNDIKENKNPFLIYREQDSDNSYVIDILPSSAELKAHYRGWTDVPVEALNASNSSVESTAQEKEST